MHVIGIDPGKKGAIVAINTQTNQIVGKHLIPYVGKECDLRSLKDIFYLYKNIALHVAMEKVHAMQVGGNSSNFNFGKICGYLEALIVTTDIPYTLVSPKTWQKTMFEGVSLISKQSKTCPKTGKIIRGSVDNKQMAAIAAKRLFPNEDLRATQRSKIPHDGIIDALLIAEYGRRKLI